MQDNNEKKAEKKRRFPVWAMILCAILALLIVAGGAVCIFIGSKLSKINKYDPDAVDTVPPEDETFETDPYVEGTDVIEPGDINWAEDTNTLSKEGVTNILLIGQDTRQEGIKGRSDSMMVLTIDKTTKKIKVTSLMRDMYVQIPGYSDNRINVAYYFGGYDLLKATIEKNLGITIDHFVEVDFFAFQKVVDILGGIYIDLNEEEALALKSWGHRTVVGRNRLDGAAALSYCTMRYVGNSDYERTQRQRRALSAIYDRLKENITVPKIVELVDAILPLVTTNMTNGEIMSHAMGLYGMNAEGVEQYRLPLDGTFTPAYINGMAVLIPDLEKNREYLWEIIYGVKP
ncbi:MAG: LytR family transcriptional regulator [Ruminococcaceae bacterium]|nr:LytR family transcriptional regulator [Oscillospiraceae bacterium]